MRTIVLISCGKRKLPYRARADEIYTGNNFQLQMKYAISLNPDAIHVLSAKHGLLDLDTIIDPYNVTLNEMSDIKIREWSKKVIDSLREKGYDLKSDYFILLAGKNYRKFLEKELANNDAPFKHVNMFQLPAEIKRRLQ